MSSDIDAQTHISSAHHEPKVSVIIPTYKRPQLVLRAIRSALLQTEKDIEVIVVDGGSDDETSDSIASLHDKRVHFYSFPKNRGGSAARNEGIKHACGTFVAFLDSDDEWSPSKIEKQLDTSKNFDVSGDWFIYSAIGNPGDRNGVRIVSPRIFKSGIDDISTFLIREGNYIISSGLFMRKETALKYPFDESLRRFQDTNLVIRMVHGGVVPFLCEESIVFYCNDLDDRISVQSKVEPIIFFENKMRGLLSRQARTCFMFDVFRIQSKDLPLSALFYLVKAFFVSPLTTCSLIFHFFLGKIPLSLRTRIKSAF